MYSIRFLFGFTDRNTQNIVLIIVLLMLCVRERVFTNAGTFTTILHTKYFEKYTTYNIVHFIQSVTILWCILWIRSKQSARQTSTSNMDDMGQTHIHIHTDEWRPKMLFLLHPISSICTFATLPRADTATTLSPIPCYLFRELRFVHVLKPIPIVATK